MAGLAFNSLAGVSPSVAAFESLFPVPTVSPPTPTATPRLGFAPDSQSFGSGDDSTEPLDDSSLDARRFIALSRAKSFLRVVAVHQDDLSSAGAQKMREALKSKATPDIEAAFKLLLTDWPDNRMVDDDLLEWYISSVRADFRQSVGPYLQDLWLGDTPSGNFQRFATSCKVLHYSQRMYSTAVAEYMMPVLSQSGQVREYRGRKTTVSSSKPHKLARIFSKSLHAIFLDSFPAEKLQDGFIDVTYLSCCSIFRLNSTRGSSTASKYEVRHESSLRLMQLFENLKDVGLGGDPAVRAFAQAMEKVVNKFVYSVWMEVDWANQQPVIANLIVWIEKAFTPFVKKAVTCLTGEEDARLDEEETQWLSMAISWLGKSRIEDLFRYVCWWPQSLGAVLDLKAYVTVPEARKHLTVRFQQEIEKRLLHVGATTKHILDVYMLLIQTFTTLDSRGVLLDNVSRPIKKYLKGRSDTAKIIISSMLADISDEEIQQSPDISKAIAEEMLKPINIATELQRQDYDLDYDNMNYMPQPNDASPDFKRNESNDAVSHLFSLYDKEQFIGALRNILGEHLLRATDDVHLEKETHLLELFKARFGEEKLQACEVMLQDIANSRRLNKTIHSMPEFRRGMEDPDGQSIDLDTQVISSYFWPDLRDDEFAVPRPIQQLQKLYEQGFESHHNLMRLKWLSSLGRATVELELSDRVVTETVPTWVASVVYAFNSKDEASPSPVKTIDELVDELHMEESLMRNGIAFWVGKRVLEETHTGSYRVVESLSSESKPADTVMMQEEVSAVKSTQDLLEENADIYRVFVEGMLRNQGSMPLTRILDMLKIALPGGFPFAESDLKGILEAMVNESLLLSSGDVYSVKKG